VPCGMYRETNPDTATKVDAGLKENKDNTGIISLY
jgi:hypothetical protein